MYLPEKAASAAAFESWVAIGQEMVLHTPEIAGLVPPKADEQPRGGNEELSRSQVYPNAGLSTRACGCACV